MRIAPEQITKAVQTIRQRLGDVPVWLFGSPKAPYIYLRERY